MKWKLEKRKIKDLYEYAKNPRNMHKTQTKHLQESIKKFGQCEPIVINKDGTIIGGHQRVRTLRKMGHKEVDVSIPDNLLSEKEVEELNIRLNKISGNWDFDLLGNAWDPDDLVEYGFSMEELHLEEIPGKEEEEEEKNSNKNSTMTIRFKDPEHLQEAENRISVIIDEYKGATYKVKVK